MGMPWVKLYVDLLDDTKLGVLSESAQLLFFKLLLVAAEQELNGALPSFDATLSRLKMTRETFSLGFSELVAHELIKQGHFWIGPENDMPMWMLLSI